MSPRLRSEPVEETAPALALAPDPVPEAELAPGRRPGPLAVWAGLGAVGLGLVVILLGWGIVASKVDARDQLAPLVAAGLGGMAVIVIGLAVLHTAIARRDEDEHVRQLAVLTEVLDDLRHELAARR